MMLAMGLQFCPKLGRARTGEPPGAAGVASVIVSRAETGSSEPRCDSGATSRSGISSGAGAKSSSEVMTVPSSGSSCGAGAAQTGQDICSRCRLSQKPAAR